MEHCLDSTVQWLESTSDLWALEWAILGYAIPVLNGVSAFSWVSLGTAAGTGLSVGIEKAIKLYFTNSNGEPLKKENEAPLNQIPVVK